MLYATIKELVLPPGILWLILAFGFLLLLFRRRWLGLIVTGLGLAVFYFVSTPYGAGVLSETVETYPPLTESALSGAGAQAIVILGGGFLAAAPEYGDETVDHVTLERLRYGAYLQRRTGLPILVTGGQVRDASKPVAVLMKQALESDFGVTVRWVEDKSLDTYENAMFSAPILKADEISKVLLVTHAVHMSRSMDVFTTAGLTPIAAPTGFVGLAHGNRASYVPRLSGLQGSYYALYEIFGQVWYKLRYGDVPDKTN